MSFVFPPTFADLAQKTPPLDERMKKLRLREFEQAFPLDNNIILERFQFVYNLVGELRDKFDAQAHQQLLELLHNQILHLKDEGAFNATLFLILNLLPLQQKKTQQPTQPVVKNSQQTVKKALRCVLHTLQNKSIPKEAGNYILDLVLLFRETKETETRELITNILMHAINHWPHDLQNIKTHIMNLTYESEASVTQISAFYARCYRAEEGITRQFMHDSIQLLIAHISQSKNTQVENIAVKNLKEILNQTSKAVAKYFYNNLSNLMQLYECENYFLRNALTEVITNVIEYLVIHQDTQHDQEAVQAAKLKLIDTLLFRQHDKVAFSRQAILNSFSTLLKKNCVPSECLGPLFEMTTGRIKDVSGWVRKAAIQNLKQIVKHFRQIYVVSQGSQCFYTLQEVNDLLLANERDQQQIENVFEQVKNEFENKDDTKIENDRDLHENMVYIKKETDRILNTKELLNEYKAFLFKIQVVMQPISILMGSRSQGDVITSIKLASYMTRYKLEGFQVGFKKLLLLIWSSDKPIKQEVIKQFKKLFINNFNIPQQIEKIIHLYQKADLQEETSINEILSQLMSDDQENRLSEDLYDELWQRIYKSPQDVVFYLRFVRVFVQNIPNICGADNIQWLEETLKLYKTKPPQWGVIKEVCKIFNLLPGDKGSALGSHLLVKHFGCEDPRWFQVCEEVLNLIIKQNNPERIFELLIKQLSKKVQGDNSPSVIDEEESESMEVEYEPSTPNTSHIQFAQLVFTVGHVSLKLLSHIDDLVHQVKATKPSSVTKNQESELDKISGGQEAEQFKKIEKLQEIAEKKILQQNMIATFIPFVLKVVQNVHRNKRHIRKANVQNTLLEKISVITLCKFMCVSEDFCRDNLDTLFNLLKSDSIDYSVKNNIIISMGDLLHRFPNVVQQYHKQIYSNLHDQNPIVRKITLLVLTHLILNDMIKSKVSLQHIPRLLCDDDPKIPSMARYFLSELQKKDPRSILNSIPDLMSNLHNNHETVIPQIISYIDKVSIEPLVERLITNIAESEDGQEIRSIALCISLLNIPILSFKKILDKWEEIRPKFADKYVQDAFRNLLRKSQSKKSQNNAEMKSLLDELEEKLDNFKHETFDGKKRVPVKKSKRQQQQIDMEVEGQVQQETRPQKKIKAPQVKKQITKKRKRVISDSEDEQSPPILIEDSDEE